MPGSHAVHLVSLTSESETPHGHAILTPCCPPDGRPFGHRPVHLDDRAAGDDALLLVPAATTCCRPTATGWAGFDNYTWFLNSPDFWLAISNTLLLVGGVLVITVVGGILIALLIDQPIWGQGIAAHPGDLARSS